MHTSILYILPISEVKTVKLTGYYRYLRDLLSARAEVSPKLKHVEFIYYSEEFYDENEDEGLKYLCEAAGIELVVKKRWEYNARHLALIQEQV
jgi:hypothetical protein